MQKHIILGTAGHIDHGKTSLIRALTGVDTDRLPEEKQRGITIELGFAHIDLSDEIHVGIVDVPGHEKFVHHMVAGVGGMDMVMMVVAADEGIMPQTREHMAICQLLGVRHGLVVLTKTDMVDEEWLELVQDDIHDYLAGTFLSDAPIIPVSSTTGAGMERLKKTLSDLASEVQPRLSGDPFRLPIDRVFTIRGFGTVVTGTVAGGSVADGETLTIVPGQQACKIRGLQVHGSKVDRLFSGQRAAVNIQNIDKDTIQRGMMLTLPDTIPESMMIDAECDLIASAAKPLKNRAPIRFHSGTSEILGRVVLMDRDVLMPGDRAFVQFRLIEMAASLPGDRFVIRSYSPVVTIGGGRILDAEPPKHKRLKPETLAHFSALAAHDPMPRLEAALAMASINGLGLKELIRRFPDPETDVNTLLTQAIKSDLITKISGSSVKFVSRKIWSQLQNKLIQTIATFHQRFPLRPGINREELRTSLKPQPPDVILDAALQELLHQGKLAELAHLIKLLDFQPVVSSEQQKTLTRMVTFISQSGIDGFTQKEITDAVAVDAKILKPLFQHLLDSGDILRLPGGLFLDAKVIGTIEEKLRNILVKEGSVAVAGFRDTMGISRKQAVPLLEYFDSIGLTRRKGDVRVLREGL